MLCAALAAGYKPAGRTGYNPMFRLALREAVDQFADPLREVPEIRQQIGAETRKRDMWRRENQHHAEQKQVHEIDHHERKKCALIAQVRLIFQDLPACECKMKR